MDNSCGLPSDECQIQQEAISEYLAAIKDASDPRVAYVTYAVNAEVRIEIDNATYNDIINNKIGAGNRKEYINLIKSFNCGPRLGADRTNLQAGINKALEELKYGTFTTPEALDRDKKIVLFNNCEDNENPPFDPCSLLQDDTLKIEGRSVEITVVNIKSLNGAMPNFNGDSYAQCLAEDEIDRFIYIPSVDLAEFEGTISQFVDAVCENETPSPSEIPTREPSMRPTGFPTESPSDPTPEPTKAPQSDNPTQSPLEGPCGFNYDADIIFIVDTSCGFNENECDKQQNLISDIMQSIKTSNEPRIGYIDCDISFLDDKDSAMQIRLNDGIFNHPNKAPDIDDLRELYFNKIADRIACNLVNGNGVPRSQCIQYALDEFTQFSKDKRKKKILMVSACKSIEDVCYLSDTVNDENIEIILINIGDENSDENVCLLRDFDKELVFRYPDIQFNEQDARDITDSVTDAICSEPTPIPTPIPTTTSPSKSPSIDPSRSPSLRPTC